MLVFSVLKVYIFATRYCCNKLGRLITGEGNYLDSDYVILYTLYCS